MQLRFDKKIETELQYEEDIKLMSKQIDELKENDWMLKKDNTEKDS
jgi:hypothetical protein